MHANDKGASWRSAGGQLVPGLLCKMRQCWLTIRLGRGLEMRVLAKRMSPVSLVLQLLSLVALLESSRMLANRG